MKNYVIEPNFADININFSEPDFNPNIDDGIKQTISRLVGYDYTNKVFRLVSVDESGAIGGGGSESGSTTGSVSKPDVTDTAGIIVPTNGDREYLKLSNNTGNDVWLGFDINVTVGNGFLLGSGKEIILQNYTGLLYAICVSGTITLDFLELT